MKTEWSLMASVLFCYERIEQVCYITYFSVWCPIALYHEFMCTSDCNAATLTYVAENCEQIYQGIWYLFLLTIIKRRTTWKILVDLVASLQI